MLLLAVLTAVPQEVGNLPATWRWILLFPTFYHAFWEGERERAGPPAILLHSWHTHQSRSCLGTSLHVSHREKLRSPCSGSSYWDANVLSSTPSGSDLCTEGLPYGDRDPSLFLLHHTNSHLLCITGSFLLHLQRTPEKAMAPHSSTLAWKIPSTEEPGRVQSMGSLRVGHNWATPLSLFTFMHWRRKWQPTPVFLPGESQGQESLVGRCLWGHTESDTTEVT